MRLLHWGAIGLVRNIQDEINKSLKDLRAEEATLFFEFYDPTSFAGTHYAEPHQVSLIDVSIHNKGFVNPNDFVKQFKSIPQAKMLYYGNPNAQFLEAVRSGTLEGMTFEGVVCKATRSKSSHPVTSFKVKNQAWIDRLRSTVSAEDFERLL